MENEIKSIDKLIAEFFSVFDNRQDKSPDLNDIRKLFIEGAVITKREGENISVMSVDEFIEPRKNLLLDGTLLDFHEFELDSITKVEGGIASRLCNYSKNGLMNGEVYRGQGKKHFQFVKKGGVWKVVSVLWEDLD